MSVVMCDSPEILTLGLILGLFVVMDILLAVVVLDIIGISFRFVRHELQNVKIFKKNKIFL